MRFLSLAKLAAGLAVMATILAACTVVVEDGPDRRPPSRPDGPGICTREYAPVCGQRGDDRRTFGNACMARADGYRIVGQGECRRGGGGDGGGGGWGRPPQQACTMDYRPVCGERRGDRQTFSNACVAEAEGYRVVREGECRGGGGGGGWAPPQRACTREYAPVCARRGRDVRTFGNSCEAEAAEYRIMRPGAC